MKNKRFFIAAAAVAGVLGITAIFGCAGFSDYAAVIEANWRVVIPSAAEYSEVFKADDGSSFNGDGVRYHVFAYRNEDKIVTLFEWKMLQTPTIYCQSQSQAADEWLTKLDVADEYRPDYAACSYWYQSQSDNSEIIIFWDADADRLYVAESFL